MTDELDPLRRASAALLYPSETDAAFEVLTLETDTPQISQEHLLPHTRRPKGAKVEEIPLADFFDELADADDAEQFEELRKTVQQQLRNLRVFRFGEVEVDVFIVGKTLSGKWAALKTKSVET